MLIDSEPVREIYLIFMDGDPYFFNRYLKDGFKHVFSVERLGLGWVCFDANLRDMNCTILPAAWEHDVISCFAKDNPWATILQLYVYPSNREQVLRWGILSCVGVVKYMLGVSWGLCISPYQLYCRLIKGQTEHIKVGRVWVAAAPEEVPMRQQKGQVKRQKD